MKSLPSMKVPVVSTTARAEMRVASLGDHAFHGRARLVEDQVRHRVLEEREPWRPPACAWQAAA